MKNEKGNRFLKLNLAVFTIAIISVITLTSVQSATVDSATVQLPSDITNLMVDPTAMVTPTPEPVVYQEVAGTTQQAVNNAQVVQQPKTQQTTYTAPAVVYPTYAPIPTSAPIQTNPPCTITYHYPSGDVTETYTYMTAEQCAARQAEEQAIAEGYEKKKQDAQQLTNQGNSMYGDSNIQQCDGYSQGAREACLEILGN